MWRAMNSLLVLRDQVNALAPNRLKGADGLVGDAAHQATNSDHNPHYVAGVGDEMVTALDLTHDPDHGFDSYAFAEILRQHRDPRIKYVISNHRLFSSYSTSSRAAWSWGPYSGVDPHTNHVHISVLDAVISDTRTPWNLEGFDMSKAEVLDALDDATGYVSGGVAKWAAEHGWGAAVSLRALAEYVWQQTYYNVPQIAADVAELKARPAATAPPIDPATLQTAVEKALAAQLPALVDMVADKLAARLAD
jgi:hypothetical protein